MRPLVWLPVLCAAAAVPADVALRRPGAATFPAFAAGVGFATALEHAWRSARARDAGGGPALRRPWSAAFAFPTGRRRATAAVALAWLVVALAAGGRLRAGKLGFLRELPKEGADDLAALARLGAIFGAGFLLWYGSRWVLLVEVGASMARRRPGTERAPARDLRAAMFAPGWETQLSARLGAIEALHAARGDAAGASAARAARGAAEALARHRDGAARPALLRTLAFEARDEALRGDLWRALEALPEPV